MNITLTPHGEELLDTPTSLPQRLWNRRLLTGSRENKHQTRLTGSSGVRRLGLGSTSRLSSQIRSHPCLAWLGHSFSLPSEPQ